MTAQQTKVIRKINEAHEAERFEAAQASREAAELDERSVWIAVQVKLAEGRTAEAKAMVEAWRASKKGN